MRGAAGEGHLNPGVRRHRGPGPGDRGAPRPAAARSSATTRCGRTTTPSQRPRDPRRRTQRAPTGLTSGSRRSPWTAKHPTRSPLTSSVLASTASGSVSARVSPRSPSPCASPFRLSATLPDVRLVLAAMGPKMCAFGGAGCTVFFNWITPEFAAIPGGGGAKAESRWFGYVRPPWGTDAEGRLARTESFYRDMAPGLPEPLRGPRAHPEEPWASPERTRASSRRDSPATAPSTSPLSGPRQRDARGHERAGRGGSSGGLARAGFDQIAATSGPTQVARGFALRSKVEWPGVAARQGWHGALGEDAPSVGIGLGRATPDRLLLLPRAGATT